jgi:hypothetical protein
MQPAGGYREAQSSKAQSFVMIVSQTHFDMKFWLSMSSEI